MSTVIESSWENTRLKEEIESLRQQLASRDAEIAKLKDDIEYLYVVAIELNQLHKQVNLLRGVLLKFVNYPAEEADYPPPYKEANVALAATQDLSGLVLCEAEPAAWMTPYGGVTKSLDTEIERATFTIPLFKARKA